MCNANVKKELRNGSGESLRMQSLGIAELMDSSEATLAFLHEFKSEIFEYIDKSLSIHANTCANARSVREGKTDTKQEENKLKLAIGKFLGFEAQGKAGMAISAIFWAIIGAVATVAIFHAGELAGLWGK